MKKEVIHSSKIGPTYTTTTAHGTRAGAFVFVTGQVATKPAEKLQFEKPLEGSIEEQTVQVLENIKMILEEAGTSLDNVVKRNTYLTHVGDFPIVYKIMEKYFPSQVASTGVLAGLMPAGARVEIDVIAIIPD